MATGIIRNNDWKCLHFGNKIIEEEVVEIIEKEQTS